MQNVEDVVRLEDIIDKMSSFGERIGLRINRFVKSIGNGVKYVFVFLFFGVIAGIFIHFFKGLFGIKVSDHK